MRSYKPITEEEALLIMRDEHIKAKNRLIRAGYLDGYVSDIVTRIHLIEEQALSLVPASHINQIKNL